MAHPLQVRKRAIQMRKKGVSIPKIAKNLSIAKSTASLWVSPIPLPDYIRDRLVQNSMKANEKGREIMRVRRLLLREEYQRDAKRLVYLFSKRFDKSFWKLCAAILFWCEGGKRQLGSLYFTNSDPTLLITFLHALRNAFRVDEKKFRIALYLHEYHDEKKQKKFWSLTTQVPERQFSKTYIKPHTKKRQRDGYQGCASLRYYDATLAKQLDAIYHAFSQKVMGVW